MKFLEELNLTQNYLFSIALVSISSIANSLVSISGKVFNDLSHFFVAVGVISGLASIIVSTNLIFFKKTAHFLAFVVFMLITVLFMSMGILHYLDALLV